MARPKSKTELLQLSQENSKKLMDLVGAMSPAEQTREFASATMNRNIRDVLTRLHHWHLMLE